jgi:O-antigen/teichoic acid export membrane protein
VIQKHGRPASLRHIVPVCFVLGLFLGWIPGFLHWSLWAVYAGLLALYVALSLWFSALAGRKAGWDLLPVLPFVFLVYHISFGLGFAGGLLDFVILQRRPRAAMSNLTRRSTPERHCSSGKRQSGE